MKKFTVLIHQHYTAENFLPRKTFLNKKVCTWTCHLKNILHSSAVKMQNPEIISCSIWYSQMNINT